MNADESALPPGVHHLRCNNPGPMTLTGTNSYVVAVPEDTAGVTLVVIDPGPDDRAHRESLVAAVRSAVRGAGHKRVAIALTHHHDDHEGGAAALVQALAACDIEAQVLGGGSGQALVDGGVIGDLQAVATPGHTADSFVFLLERAGSRVLFSGDTVLGAGSSFIAHPDGNLTAYLASLDTLAELVNAGGWALAPGHGPVGADADSVIEQYREHRAARLDEVREALEGAEALRGDALLERVIEVVYQGTDAQLRPAVEAVVRAQLAHLGRL